MGVPLCSNLEIVYDGCEPRMNSPVNTVKLLDRAVIKVSPPLKKGESLKLPKQKGSKVSIVEDVELESYSDKNGLYISGVANFKTYERLLREVVYQNLNPDNKLRHRFYVSLLIEIINKNITISLYMGSRLQVSSVFIVASSRKGTLEYNKGVHCCCH